MTEAPSGIVEEDEPVREPELDEPEELLEPELEELLPVPGVSGALATGEPAAELSRLVW